MMNRLKEKLRRCIKCGSSPSEDASIILNRFPKPGPTNSLRCELWAKYCFPNEPWSSPVFQGKLYSQHKMLCSKHFQKSCYVDRKLFKTAVPTEESDEIENDMENYIQYKMVGGKIKLTEDSEQNEDDAGGADCAKDATSADNANSASATTCADITTGEENIDAETDIQDCPIVEETDEQLFSWQRDSEIDCDDFDVNQDSSTLAENVTGLDNIVVKTVLDDSLCLHGTASQTVEQVFKASEENDVHEGYRCDMCSGPIHRFRYSCVECANYDLCSACEASRGHPQHYLLRIPRPRPHGEIQLIMDTIRRFLTADLKSLRTEANFVDTLMNEMKSEASSEAGSDPVPDEPDYPVQSRDSSDDEDGQMEETFDTHSQDALETLDESQDITWLDEDILQDSEPQETSDNLETIENNPNTISTHTTLKLNVEHPHRPEKRKVNKFEKGTPPIALGKVKKRVVINIPKKVSISNDVFELIKAQDGDPMERTINTVKHSLQSNVSIRVQRLSKEELEAVTPSNKLLRRPR